MTQLMYFLPATGSPFTPSVVSGTTITVSSTSNLTAGMYVENATYNINTTISSITNLTQFVVASATNITTSTPLNIGTWVTAMVGAQGSQGPVGATAAAYATSDLTTQSAAISTTTIYTSPVAGLYTIQYYAKVTTAATTSSTLGAFSIISINADNNTVTTVGNSSTQNSLTAGFISGSITVYAKAGSAIQYTMGYASSGATAMVYELHMVVGGGAVNTTSSNVTTFNGRGGTVLPVSGDYSFSQISGTAALATQVAGTLAVANGGTGVTTSTGTGNNVLSASPTLTGTVTLTGTTIVLQTAGAFANNDILTMRYMGAI